MSKLEKPKTAVVAISKILEPKYPVRTYMIKEALEGLAESLRHGEMEYPIIVRPVGDKFEIIDGHRRYLAAKMAGWKEVPVIVKDVEDKEALIKRLVVGLQHEDFDPIGEAEGFALLRESFKLGVKNIAERFGVSHSYVSNRIRLLALPNKVKEMIANRQLDPSKALELLVYYRSDYVEGVKKAYDVDDEGAMKLIDDHTSSVLPNLWCDPE